MTIQFQDKSVQYATFLNDLAARIADYLHQQHEDPEYISQRKAWQIFGRRNVERWVRAGRIPPIKRPGRTDYETSRLRLLQRTQQDYLFQ